MADNNRNYEEPIIHRIPANYDRGVNIGNFTFKLMFLIEGIVLCVIFGVTPFLIMKYLVGMDDTARIIGFSLCFALLALFFGVKGINDEPITVFIRNMMNFQKNKRRAYYNPRVKAEAKSIVQTHSLENKDAPVKEKIVMLWQKNREAKKARAAEKEKQFEEDNRFEEGNLYFTDDVGFVKRPKRYMTDEQLNEYDNKKKKIIDLKRELDEEDY